MKFKSLRIRDACLAAIPNLLILSVLIGIGYWGHTQHWRIPKFSELLAGASQNSHGKDAPASVEATKVVQTKQSDVKNDNAPAESASRLPLIQFSSPVLRKSGITLGSVEERRVDEFVSAYGTVTYDETQLAQLSCRVSGIVWRVEKQLGDDVKKGQILAIFDSNDVGRAKAEVLEADVKSDLAVQTLTRLSQAGEAIPVRAIREAESEVRLSKVRRFNAQQALLNLGLPISMQELTGLADTELADRLHFLGLPQDVVATLDPDTASANLIPLLSPLDGMIISRDIVTGEVVTPGHPQFIVANVKKMWLILNVRREDASALEVGQAIFFSATGLSGEVQSKLTWIATESDKRTRSVQVRAEVDNPPQLDQDGKPTGRWLFRANMYGSGRIRIRQRPYALVVPSSAVQWDGNQHLVFTPQDDGLSFQAHPVTLGVIQGGYTEIRQGVDQGQPIVATGSYLLKSELMGVEN